MPSEPILPCPFCGAELVEVAMWDYQHPRGECILSGFSFLLEPGEEGAWNRRAAPTEADQ